MKKIVAFTLLLCMAFTLAACGKVDITMQEIYDASKTEAILENHENVYIRNEMAGELWRETYLTKDYSFDYIPHDEFPWVQFMTDDACYHHDAGNTLLYLFISPDGVGSFASKRAETYASFILGEDVLGQNIESVSKKDGRIVATSALSSKDLELLAEDGLTAGKFEYVLDAKTREIVSIISDYTYDDGMVFNDTAKLTYDAEVPEMVKEFLGYVNRTEDLRNVTIVSNPGTDKEESKTIKAPKGLVVGFQYGDEFENAAEFYADAACTKGYDPFADTVSDLTVYIKWTIS